MSRKARKNIGLIGLGIIGTRVTAGLRAAGFQVYVWNRTARPMPNFLGSPAEVAEAAEIIQIFVADAEALLEVVEAMSEALTTRHLVICSATVGPEAVIEAAQLVEARGAQFLDAPFTGSKVAAEKRQLVYYIGGTEAAFLRASPVLEATSRSIVRIGAIGHASTVKVVTNMISAVTVQTLAEALCIVQRAGLDPEVLAAALENNACRSGVIDLKLPKMVTGDYEPHFSLKHMFKDVQLGIHMANALDLEIPATTLTAGVMFGAINQGWGDLDFSVIFRNYAPQENRQGLPALGPGEDLTEVPNSETENSGGNESAPVPLDSLEPLVATAGKAGNGGRERDLKPAEAFVRTTEAAAADGAGDHPEDAPVILSLPPEPLETGESFVVLEGKPAPQSEAENGAGLIQETAEPGNSVLSEDAEEVASAAAAALADESGVSSKPNNFIRRWFSPRPRS